MTDIGRRELAREPISLWGSYRNGRGNPRDVHFKDLNLQGCQFFDKFCRLEVGENLLLTLGSVGPIAAIVRWTNQFHVGVEFRDAIHVAVFDHLKRSQSETAENSLGGGLSNW
ncbi:PilZ domain-containing protein [Altererythrobacter sp. MTPC7]|uniref:PilZ domain-containing protein n=1 Tax=Altererythrobacter sp. MTPC7 TaxID=3056567 RepID=UPI0036F39D96